MVRRSRVSGKTLDVQVSDETKGRSGSLAVGVGAGAGAGFGLGLLFGNALVGILAGVAIGAAIGLALRNRAGKDGV